MDEFHKKILNQLHEQLLDINVDYGIIDKLCKDMILNERDIDNIKKFEDRERRTKALLNILPERGPLAFTSFHGALKNRYGWLYEDINKMENEEYGRRRRVQNDPPRLCRSPVMPVTPELKVDRREKMEELKAALYKLVPGGYVVLHGMKGYGRSCLAAHTLEDKSLVQNLFQNKVHWLKFGRNDSVTDEIWIQLNNLYGKTINIECPMRNINSQEEERRIQLRKNMLHEINCYFTENSKSLLVLDDVRHADMIKTFDFNCKTLVITTDIDLLKRDDGERSLEDRSRIVIQMKEGFTQEESLRLFATALETTVESLPPEAQEIHYECSGMPLLIAMFAAQFKEFKDDMVGKNRERWKHYLKVIRQKDKSNRVMGEFLNKHKSIFNMCINPDILPEPELSRYKMLAIFSEDVNIMPKTLGILWEDDEFKVEEMMVDLCNKSLAVKLWNADLGSYIYGVHDLLLCHLKDIVGEEGLITMHHNFVKKYFKSCNNDLSKLPADNYSYSYIGYHLEHAKMHEEFKRVYLDLGFVQGKLINSGVNDLLLDLKKYRVRITNGNTEELESKVVDLENFIKSHAKTIAEYRERDCLDLIQMALNSGLTNGYIHQKAKELANSRPEHLYLFNNCNKQSTNNRQSTNNYNTLSNITLRTMCFTDDENKILIGGESGKLILWNYNNLEENISFSGFDNNSTIIKILPANNGKFFVALNDKSAIKLFNLSDVEGSTVCNEQLNSELTLTKAKPHQKQLHWNRMHRSKSQDFRVFSCSEQSQITDIALTADDKRLAACTKENGVQIWDIETGKKFITQFSNKDNQQFQLLAFSSLGYLHAVNTKGSITVFGLNTAGDCYEYKSKFNPIWKDKCDDRRIHNDEQVKVIYFRDFPEESDFTTYFIYVTEHKAYKVFCSVIESTQTVSNPDVKTWVESKSPHVKFRTATLTHDGKYLIIADASDTISVWDTDMSFGPAVRTYSERSIALDTYYISEYQHLIISGTEHYLQWFYFEPSTPLPISRPRHCDAVLNSETTAEPSADIVAFEFDEHQIGIYENNKPKVITELIPNAQIVSLCLNKNGDKLLYAINTGAVMLFDINTKKHVQVTALNEMKLLDFMKLIEFDDEQSNEKLLFILCRQKDKLIVNKYGEEIVPHTYDVPGLIVQIHNIDNKFVVTVTENENIIIWEIGNITMDSAANFHSEWKIICQHCANNNRNSLNGTLKKPERHDFAVVNYSTLNSDNTMLAILKTNKDLGLFNIRYNTINTMTFPVEIVRISDYLHFSNASNLSCCAFSPDSKMLAVGARKGEIMLFNIDKRNIDFELNIHCQEIQQLHWAPSEVGVPILLAVNCDELAWYNTALMNNTKRRSRTGIPRSNTIPLSSSEINDAGFGRTIINSPPPSPLTPFMRNSLTLDLNPTTTGAGDLYFRYDNLSISSNSFNGNNSNIDEKAYNYWSRKKSPYGNKWPPLLGLIPLPPHCRRAKVFVSSDFSKFLLVDANGTINNYKLFNYN